MADAKTVTIVPLKGSKSSNLENSMSSGPHEEGSVGHC